MRAKRGSYPTVDDIARARREAWLTPIFRSPWWWMRTRLQGRRDERRVRRLMRRGEEPAIMGWPLLRAMWRLAEERKIIGESS